VLGTTDNRPGGSSANDDDDEGFRRAIVRNIRAAVTRRAGTRIRTPTKFFDSAPTNGTGTTTSGGEVHREPAKKKVGDSKRHASINVRTLAMKGDKNHKETCGGKTAAAVKWVIEFEEWGLEIIGLQECRVPGGIDGSEGNYPTFYSGNEDGKRQHGVGIYMHSTATSGEFDIQPVNERIMWMNGAIYGVKQTVFSVYALTNKSDNAAEMDNFYSTLERQVSAVRTRVETKIVILGDFNARVGTDGSDNATEENNETGTSDSRKPMIMEQNYSLSV
jgi:hypothetical protein